VKAAYLTAKRRRAPESILQPMRDWMSEAKREVDEANKAMAAKQQQAMGMGGPPGMNPGMPGMMGQGQPQPMLPAASAMDAGALPGLLMPPQPQMAAPAL